MGAGRPSFSPLRGAWLRRGSSLASASPPGKLKFHPGPRVCAARCFRGRWAAPRQCPPSLCPSPRSENQKAQARVLLTERFQVSSQWREGRLGFGFSPRPGGPPRHLGRYSPHNTRTSPPSWDLSSVPPPLSSSWTDRLPCCSGSHIPAKNTGGNIPKSLLPKAPPWFSADSMIRFVSDRNERHPPLLTPSFIRARF